EVIIIGGNQIKLIAGSIPHHRGKEVVCERKLLRPTPQNIDSGSGVVIVPHGNVAVEKGIFVHGAVVPHLQQVLPNVRHVRYGNICEERRCDCLTFCINLRKSRYSGPDPFRPGECPEEVVKGPVLHHHDNDIADRCTRRGGGWGGAGAHFYPATTDYGQQSNAEKKANGSCHY